SVRPFQGRKDRVRKLTEVSAMWLLDSHPNLVRLVNSWEQFGLLYILSDLCDQGDLQSLLNSFNLPVPEPFVWKLLSAVSSGLAHIHSHDFVHLDLKPANICFADNYATIKIADFGLASPISSLPSPSSSPSPDHEGDRVYLAPEVLHHGLCGKPADIFSLGLIVLEMCANVVLPHNGEEYSQLRSNNLSSAQLDLVSISDELRSLISQMLDSDPSKRPTAQHIASLPLCSTYSQIPFNLH
ncbi:Membrane-associated tyrosine- and threonine-specific cdc2-inhibitory kinase, partial [Zancudomyces culisetae]